MKHPETLQLTTSALQFLYEEATPILAADFVGYVSRYSKHAKIGIGVDLKGSIYIFSLTDKPLTCRKIERILKKLIYKQFLEYVIEPFPEFSEKHNLKFNLSKALIVEGNYFGAV